MEEKEEYETGNKGGVFRRVKKHNYVSIHNDPLNDSRLSWAARGLLAYLLSKPHDWQTNMRNLVNESPLGRDGVQTIIKELEKFGYFRRQRVRGERGRFTYVTGVYEFPEDATVDGFTVNGLAGNGGTGNGGTVDGEPVHILSTDLLSTDKQKTEEQSTEPLSFNLEEKKVDSTNVGTHTRVREESFSQDKKPFDKSAHLDRIRKAAESYEPDTANAEIASARVDPLDAMLDQAKTDPVNVVADAIHVLFTGKSLPDHPYKWDRHWVEPITLMLAIADNDPDMVIKTCKRMYDNESWIRDKGTTANAFGAGFAKAYAQSRPRQPKIAQLPMGIEPPNVEPREAPGEAEIDRSLALLAEARQRHQDRKRRK